MGSSLAVFSSLGPAHSKMRAVGVFEIDCFACKVVILELVGGVGKRKLP